MPSISSHTPYETLAFFQSVARHGANASALQNISTALKQNEYIRNNADFDVNRLSTDTLRRLYHEYISSQNEKQSLRLNGESDDGERSPKKRKLSTTPAPVDGTVLNDERLVQDVEKHLYAAYKEDMVRQIKKDEEAFTELQDEIRKLEQGIQVDSQQQLQEHKLQPSATQPEGYEVDVDTRRTPNTVGFTQSQSRSASAIPEPSMNSTQKVVADPPGVSTTGPQLQTAKPALLADGTALRSLSTTQPTRGSQPPTPVPSQHQSPRTFPRQLPSTSPQRTKYGAIQAQPGYPPGQTPPLHMMPQIAGVQQRPNARGQQGSSQARGSPIQYQGQHPYPPYPQYSPAQWHSHMSPQQYQQHTPYAPSPPPQYYPQPPNMRHPQTPQQMQYGQYAHAASMPYMQQQQWRGQQWPVHSTSAGSTPISRPDSRLSMPGSGSSTPWKKKQHPSPLRPKSPSRPEREVSPLTDREDLSMPDKTIKKVFLDTSAKDEKPIIQAQLRRRGRPPSVTPSAIGPSRSQSIASRASDHQNERHNASHRGQKIKAEPPNTPVPVQSSDTEQRSSGRRGRPRTTTVTSQVDGLRATAAKRKRESVSPTSPARSSQPSYATLSSRHVIHSYDSSLVIVSKNFARTSQLLLNEITSHKLAGIFSKPLSERDAPGYKDLVMRPQDLKSVKAAISKGGRAALAAIEAIEGDQESALIRAQLVPTSSSGNVAIGNGFYLVSKSTDLVPPKGIVNSAQLEMELVRMFANAVMFNPLPSSERAFGKSLRLRKNGGDIDTDIDLEENSTSGGSESGSLSGIDEGGIIADAREMFHDVVETVGKWRELEGERMGAGTDTGTRHGSLAMPNISNAESGRHASEGASSNTADDDTAAGGSEAASTPVPPTTSGPGRKKRKIIEH